MAKVRDQPSQIVPKIGIKTGIARALNGKLVIK
jgi:hypothetical protein